LPLDDLTVALVARRAEADFAGAPVGVMDQIAASLGTVDAALLLDTSSLAWSRIRLPTGSAVMAIDSGVRHHHAGGEYRTRRLECERAAAHLGVRQLCELSLDALPRVARLPAPLDRRARHVITENIRVRDFVAALTASDLKRCGELLEAAHASLRDDFEVSLPALDALVEVALRVPRVYGARLTGGGFGGSIVVLLSNDEPAATAEAIVARAEPLGLKATAVV
jgi:galactokinase